MPVIDWVSFLYGFIVAALISNVAQLIIAYNRTRREKEKMAQFSDKINVFKEDLLKRTSSIKQEIKDGK
jgi:hypothetical protein